MPEDELRKLYPRHAEAAEDSLDPEEPTGELFTLVDRPSTVGLDEPLRRFQHGWRREGLSGS